MKHYFKIILFSFFFASYMHCQQFTKTDSLFWSNFLIPIENNGQIGDGNNTDEIKFNGISSFYETGFILTSENNGQIWVSGTTHETPKFLPGLIGHQGNDDDKQIYYLNSEDDILSANWQLWKKAVELGADFYDGDNNGIYDPIDYNNNGLWDLNEDRPNLPGINSVWVTFNNKNRGDGDEIEIRNGLQVQQTLFYFGNNQQLFPNTFFVRNRILNTGIKEELIKNIYLTVFSDGDIDYGNNDLAGYDINSQTCYFYNFADSGLANEKVNTVSAVTILQSPQVFVPGISFIDINNDGLFTPSIDTPLTNALNRKGGILGEELIQGAVNLAPVSFTAHTDDVPVLQDPYTNRALRNYQIGGRYFDGTPIVVSNCEYGNGAELGSAADTVNPKFMFSGSVLNSTGWLPNFSDGDDFRGMINFGPFDLPKDQAVEIIYAVTVADENDRFSSIAKVLQNAAKLHEFYEANFHPSVVNVEQQQQLPNAFQLFQNFPNPFNPSTTIRYNVPVVDALSGVEGRHVQLKVYDMLGREVATLVNELQSPGNYHVQFDGSSLASGVYFYKLYTDHGVNIIKKLLLLK